MEKNNKERCRLYLITPEKFELAKLLKDFREAVTGGDIAVLQLRMKNVPDEDILAAGKALLPICRENNIVFIVNDRPDLAVKIGADGVHLGEEKDGTIEEACGIIGPEMIIGYSCYDSKDRAFQAGEDSADYVAFGAFYPTKTKEPKGRPTLELLEFWSEYTTVPCVAIGGIKPDNLAPLVKAGADFIAVVSGVWQHEKGPAAAVKEYNQAIDKASSNQ